VDQVRDATGWRLAVADPVGSTEPPTPAELAALRVLAATVPSKGVA